MRAAGLLLAACVETGAGPLPPADVCAPDALPTPAATPTWSDDVAPLVEAHCVACHADGGIAPLPLQSWDQAAPWARPMAAAARSRTMPPWPPGACETCPPLQHPRTLTEDEIATLVAWADAGAPEGTPIPALPSPEPDRLHRVDATLDPGTAFTPPAEPVDTYRCFLVPSPTPTDAWLTAFRVVPGAPTVVHHAIVFVPDDAGAAADAAALDAAHDGPGWTCFGSAGVPATFTAGWAPGVGVTRLPADTGLRIPGGLPLILQVHYNVANGTAEDRTTVELALAPRVDVPARIVSLATPPFELPPGEPEVVVEGGLAVDDDGPVTLWGFAPHMHEAGARYLAQAERPGEAPSCLVDLPRWDFHWQGYYFYEAPVRLDPGDVVRARCVYDTRGRTEATRTGDGTRDEMCIGFAYVTGGG